MGEEQRKNRRTDGWVNVGSLKYGSYTRIQDERITTNKQKKVLSLSILCL